MCWPKICFLTHLLWSLAYIVIGSVELVAGIFFFVYLPIFKVGSNIWIGSWNILFGVGTMVYTLIGDWTYKKQRVLLYVTVGILCANVINLVILEIGEWHLFLPVSAKIVIEKNNLDMLVFYARTITTYTSIIGVVTAFIDAHLTLCSLQGEKRPKLTHVKAEVLSDNEYILPRVKSGSDDIDTGSYFTKPNPPMQSWVYESGTIQSHTSNNSTARQYSTETVDNIEEFRHSPSENEFIDISALQTPIDQPTVAIRGAPSEFADRQVYHMASFSRTPSPTPAQLEGRTYESSFLSSSHEVPTKSPKLDVVYYSPLKPPVSIVAVTAKEKSPPRPPSKLTPSSKISPDVVPKKEVYYDTVTVKVQQPNDYQVIEETATYTHDYAYLRQKEPITRAEGQQQAVALEVLKDSEIKLAENGKVYETVKEKIMVHEDEEASSETEMKINGREEKERVYEELIAPTKEPDVIKKQMQSSFEEEHVAIQVHEEVSPESPKKVADSTVCAPDVADYQQMYATQYQQESVTPPPPPPPPDILTPSLEQRFTSLEPDIPPPPLEEYYRSEEYYYRTSYEEDEEEKKEEVKKEEAGQKDTEDQDDDEEEDECFPCPPEEIMKSGNVEDTEGEEEEEEEEEDEKLPEIPTQSAVAFEEGSTLVSDEEKPAVKNQHKQLLMEDEGDILMERTGIVRKKLSELGKNKKLEAEGPETSTLQEDIPTTEKEGETLASRDDVLTAEKEGSPVKELPEAKQDVPSPQEIADEEHSTVSAEEGASTGDDEENTSGSTSEETVLHGETGKLKYPVYNGSVEKPLTVYSSPYCNVPSVVTAPKVINKNTIYNNKVKRNESSTFMTVRQLRSVKINRLSNLGLQDDYNNEHEHTARCKDYTSLSSSKYACRDDSSLENNDSLISENNLSHQVSSEKMHISKQYKIRPFRSKWKIFGRKSGDKRHLTLPDLDEAIMKSESLAHLSESELIERYKRSKLVLREIERTVRNQISGMTASESAC